MAKAKSTSSYLQNLAEIDYSAPLVIEMWAQNDNWFEDIKQRKQQIEIYRKPIWL
ncbi:hypothetical protein O9993_11965 [Vibrio lentus]|nr:hypothetical protein [Vibrio lentus]